MSISPKCDLKDCQEILNDFWAILLSPPGWEKNQDVKKYHICKKCYTSISKDLL